ncbi:hypothetical protein Tco_0587384, partial [Tanacetum coccineum]
MMKINQKERLKLEYQSTDHYPYVQLQYHDCLLQYHGASWSTIVEEGESIDTVGTGAATSLIRATTSGAG